MNLLSRLVVAGTVLLAIAQPSLAITPGGQPIPSAAISASPSIVERGGTINTIDAAKKSMVVDGVAYAFSAMPVTVHGLVGKGQGKAVELKAGMLRAGMQIRFNSSKHNFSAQDQVIEIWVTKEAGDPKRN